MNNTNRQTFIKLAAEIIKDALARKKPRLSQKQSKGSDNPLFNVVALLP